MDRSRLKPTSGGRCINYLKFIAAFRPLPGSRLFSKPSRSNSVSKSKAGARVPGVFRKAINKSSHNIHKTSEEEKMRLFRRTDQIPMNSRYFVPLTGKPSTPPVRQQ